MRKQSTSLSPEIRQMMAETETCLCCGKVLKYHERKDGRRNRGYCSMECYQKKPPKMAYAELVWGREISGLLCDLLSEHPVEVVAHMMGVNKQALYSWIRKLRLRKVVTWEVDAG